MSLRNIEHQRLVDDLLFHFGSRPDVRIFPRIVGVFENIRVGIPGQCDLWGFVAPRGRLLEIEVKTGKATLSNVQEKWRDLIVKFGGIYILARSVEQALADLESQL